LRKRLFLELGLILPPVVVERDNALSPEEARLQMNDLRTAPIIVPGQELLFDIVREQVYRHAAAYVTTTTVGFSLDMMRGDFPTLIDVVNSRFDTVWLTRVLRELVDESISIGDLPTILEALLTLGGTTTVDAGELIVFFPHTGNRCFVGSRTAMEELQPARYADSVRLSLGLQIAQQFANPEKTLEVYLLDRQLERWLEQAGSKPVSRDERDPLIGAVYRAVGDLVPEYTGRVLLTSFESRSTLRRLIEKEFAKLPVLCYQELPVDLNILPFNRISLG
jgi:flagellar biosynthesis component FlhA